MKLLLQILLTFLKIGTFVFGGGYAMIPAIRRETVEHRNWIDDQELTDCMAICQSLPGAFAVNTAIYVGKKVKGYSGAFMACFAMVFPAFLSILLILLFLGSTDQNPYVLGAIEGIMAVSIAMILVTAFQMGRGVLKTKIAYATAALSFLLIAVFNISAILVLLVGGLFGYVVYYYKNKTNRIEKGEA